MTHIVKYLERYIKKSNLKIIYRLESFKLKSRKDEMLGEKMFTAFVTIVHK